MQNKVTAIAAQIDVEWVNPSRNLSKLVNIVETVVKDDKPDLIVFPELSNSGYVMSREQKDFATFSSQYFGVAEKIPGSFTDTLCGYAKKYNIYIAVGLLEAHPTISGTLFNSAILIDSEGNIVGHYRKVHIPGEEKHYFYPGNAIEVYPTELGNVGLLICADVSFPEQARILSLKGAEIICVPFARPKDVAPDPDLYCRIISCRAYENNNFLIACNRVGKENNIVFEGRSCICDPRGEFLAISKVETEEIIKADLSAELLITARLRYSRFRDRRPELYGILGKPFEMK
jgi:predicted amidohydrolase